MPDDLTLLPQDGELPTNFTAALSCAAAGLWPKILDMMEPKMLMRMVLSLPTANAGHLSNAV